MRSCEIAPVMSDGPLPDPANLVARPSVSLGTGCKPNFPEQIPRSPSDPMKSKYTRILLAIAFVISVAALAQTGSAAATPAATPASPAPAATGTGTKIGTISMEQAIFATNEGRRDFDALSKKLEPKQ